MDNPAINTDRELWREKDGDFYAPSIHVTKDGGIGIDVGGMVFVKPIRAWHALARETPPLLPLPPKTCCREAEGLADCLLAVEKVFDQYNKGELNAREAMVRIAVAVGPHMKASRALADRAGKKGDGV